jgi:hypothetical protein
MSAIEKQTIDILSRLNDYNKSVVLDFVKFIEQKQLSEKESRNAAYLEKIQRGIDQCAEGHGLIRDIIEVSENILAEDITKIEYESNKHFFII